MRRRTLTILAAVFVAWLVVACGGGGSGSGSGSCPADFVPDTEEYRFSTSSLGISDPWGITYLLPGTTFRSVAAPADGAWLLVDGSNREFIMTDLAGTSLAVGSISPSEGR